MTDVHLTTHALQRMAQRGIRPNDVELIMAIGTEVRDGYLVRKKDSQEVEKALKALLKQVRRLEGKRLVICDGMLVTAYHAEHRDEQRLLRYFH